MRLPVTLTSCTAVCASRERRKKFKSVLACGVSCICVLSNPAGRFETVGVETFHDGWYVEEEPDSVATTLTPDHAKGVISTNDSPDIRFDQSINPYRGCSHGCVYCY